MQYFCSFVLESMLHSLHRHGGAVHASDMSLTEWKEHRRQHSPFGSNLKLHAPAGSVKHRSARKNMRNERTIFTCGVVFVTASSGPGGPASSCTTLVCLSYVVFGSLVDSKKTRKTRTSTNLPPDVTLAVTRHRLSSYE